MNTIINKWINDNYYVIQKAIRKFNVPERDDIFHEVLIYFMNNKKAEMLIETNRATQYIVQMFKINCYSKTSPYQQKYNKIKYIELLDSYLTTTEEEENTTICLADVEYILNEINVFFNDKLMFNTYVKNKLNFNGNYSTRKLAEEVEIPHDTLKYKIRKIKKTIKKNNT